MNNITELSIAMEPAVDTLLCDEQLELLRQAGITVLAVPPSFYDLEPALIRQRFGVLTRMGFQIDTCHPPYGGGNHANSLCAEDEQVRQAAIAMWQHYLRRFALTGMRAVPVHTGGAMHPMAGEKAMDRLTDSLRHILPDAKASGVVLALENTFYENPCPFSDAKRPSGIAQERLNDDCGMLGAEVMQWREPAIRICHDTGHSVLFGHTLEADLAQLAQLTVLYHIHDNDGIHDRHWNVGEGCFAWQTLVDSLVERAFPYPLYDEVLGEKDTSLKAVIKQPERVAAHYLAAQKVIKRCLQHHQEDVYA